MLFASNLIETFFERGKLLKIANVKVQSVVQTVKSPKGLSGKIRPRDVLRVIRLTRGTSHDQIFQKIPEDFSLFVRLWASKPKKMRPRVAPWACLEKQWVRTCSSLTVLNPDFGG